jgi:hypothetical protein
VDGGGIPLASKVSAANIADITLLMTTLLAIPLRTIGAGDPLPDELYADRAYHSQDAEGLLHWLDITPHIAQRGTPHGSGLGQHRYVVEQTIAAVHQNRRLKVRYDKRSDIHQAFLTLACIKICYYRLVPSLN